MKRRLLLLAILLVMPASVARAGLLRPVGVWSGEPSRPRLFVSALTVGAHAGLFYYYETEVLPCVDCRAAELRWFSPRGLVLGIGLGELGKTYNSWWAAAVPVSAGWLIHSGHRAFGYAVVGTEVLGLFAEYVFVPYVPIPAEITVRATAGLADTPWGTDPLELEGLVRATVGVRVGAGWWLMRED